MRECEAVIEDEQGALRIAWLEHGDPKNRNVALCVHGLTRNAHDFDMLAGDLAKDRWVLAVDVVGRGRSTWLADPLGYDVPHYARHILAWLDSLGIEQVDWIGTSMGGLIALAAAERRPEIFRSLLLNDIGPFVPQSAMAMIRDYLGLDLSFASVAEIEAHLRLIHKPFGPLTDGQWAHLAEHSAARRDNAWRLHYDPAIREAFAVAAETDIDVWPLYDALSCPTLVIRGAESLLLDDATASAMVERGPRARLVEFAGVGHAPALMAEDQIAVVRRFIEAQSQN